VNKEASHYVKLFGGNKIGNLTFWLPLINQETSRWNETLQLMVVIYWAKILISKNKTQKLY